MSFATRAGIESVWMGILLAPLIAIAMWRARERRWWPLIGMLAVIALDNFMLRLPWIGPLAKLASSWQGKLLEIALVVAIVALTPGLTWRELGLTARVRPGWRAGVVVMTAVSLALPIAFLVWLDARDVLTTEGWLFEATLPGIAEELMFRGLLLALADRAFGRPWRIAGADVGWGAIVIAVLFALVHVVNVDRAGVLHVELLLGLGPLIGGLAASWARARTGQLIPLMIAHNASNLVIPLASLWLGG
jgi:membrane protease YdiL (CAAX protease family)